jgi:AraC-like DNA-binding protein
MQILSDGSYAIEDVVAIEGTGDSSMVFGRGWLLELLEIESGEFYFYRDSKPVRPHGPFFGIFYPPFSFVRSHVNDLKGKVRGVGHTAFLDGLPAQPVMFETSFKGRFTSAADAIGIIAQGKNSQPIEPNSTPSLISIRAKRSIDHAYLSDVSIADVARQLNVSHAHLSRQFRRDFQMTPSEYLHQLRVAEATFRLSIGEPIIDISQDVGYNDLSRFYKQFRKNTRTSPGVCREILTSDKA